MRLLMIRVALMPLPKSAVENFREQQKLTMEVLAHAQRVWGRRPPANFDAWFARNVDELVSLTVQAQSRAIAGAEGYVDDALRELGTPVDPDVSIVPERMVGVASDGRPLDSLLHGSVINAGTRVKDRGAVEAWKSGFNWLSVAMQTQVADIGRSATKLAITSRARVGYVRMLNPPSCSRCAVLAGRWYRFNAAFDRHPGCNCTAIPAPEDHPRDIRTDPTQYFNSLSVEQQNRIFTNSGAEAIRAGADISQVVNVRRGATGLDSAVPSANVSRRSLQRTNVYGRDLYTSTEGVTKRGVAGKAIRERGRDPRTTPRLMPESIMELAESREDAIVLLKANGYMVDRTVPRKAKPVDRSAAALARREASAARAQEALQRTRVNQQAVKEAAAGEVARKRAREVANGDPRLQSWLEAKAAYTRKVTSWLDAETEFAAAAKRAKAAAVRKAQRARKKAREQN